MKLFKNFEKGSDQFVVLAFIFALILVITLSVLKHYDIIGDKYIKFRYSGELLR